MYQFNRDKEKFLNDLKSSNVHDQATLEWISKAIETEKLLHIPFLSYLINDLTIQELLVKLSCMNTMMAYLADEEARSKIFSFCLKTRNDQRNLFDIEVDHLIHSILEQSYFSTQLWKNELDCLSLEQKKIILETYDNIIENYMYNPSQYPTKIKFNSQLSDLDYIRFLLFNIIHESDMRPIQFENDDTIKFSNDWICFLKETNNYKHTFVMETQMIENALRNPEKKLACYIDEQEIMNTSSFYPSQIDVVIKECLQSLLNSHTSCIPIVTFSLLRLMKFAKQTCNEQAYHEYIMMCQAAWLKIFQQLLNDAVFENPEIISYKKSRTIFKLSKYCSCFVQYNRFIQYEEMNDFIHFLDTMWHRFLRTRRIYLNSTKTIDPNLIWVEKILFTSTT